MKRGRRVAVREALAKLQDFTDDLVVWVIFYGPEGGE